MINVKKIVAVVTTATMCMGMGTIAFAAPGDTSEPSTVESASKTTSYLDDVVSPIYAPDATVTFSNGDGEANTDITIDPMLGHTDTWESINTTQEVLDILKENNIADLPSGTEIVPLYAGEITSISGDEKNVLTFSLSPQDFSTRVSDIEKYHPGDTIWAMVETGNNTGVWELVPGTLNNDGKVDFTVDHTGGFILIKTMKNGEIIYMEKDGNGNNVNPPVVIDPENPGTTVTPSVPSQGTSTNAAAGAATTGTSPKTGEF